MACFTQAWLLRLSAVRNVAAAHTFEAWYMRQFSFAQGHVVCGVYRIEQRAPLKVEFAIVLPGEMSAVAGCLNIGIETNEASSTTFVSEKVQWRRLDVKGVLPLKFGLVQWLHEVGGWWLVVSGTRWFVGASTRLTV